MFDRRANSNIPLPRCRHNCVRCYPWYTEGRCRSLHCAFSSEQLPELPHFSSPFKFGGGRYTELRCLVGCYRVFRCFVYTGRQGCKENLQSSSSLFRKFRERRHGHLERRSRTVCFLVAVPRRKQKTRMCEGYELEKGLESNKAESKHE